MEIWCHWPPTLLEEQWRSTRGKASPPPPPRQHYHCQGLVLSGTSLKVHSSHLNSDGSRGAPLPKPYCYFLSWRQSFIEGFCEHDSWAKDCRLLDFIGYHNVKRFYLIFKNPTLDGYIHRALHESHLIHLKHEMWSWKTRRKKTSSTLLTIYYYINKYDSTLGHRLCCAHFYSKTNKVSDIAYITAGSITEIKIAENNSLHTFNNSNLQTRTRAAHTHGRTPRISSTTQIFITHLQRDKKNMDIISGGHGCWWLDFL